MAKPKKSIKNTARLAAAKDKATIRDELGDVMENFMSVRSILMVARAYSEVHFTDPDLESVLDEIYKS